jgi:hypothetical protein
LGSSFGTSSGSSSDLPARLYGRNGVTLEGHPLAVIKVVLRCGATERGAVVTIGSVSTNE